MFLYCMCTKRISWKRFLSNLRNESCWRIKLHWMSRFFFFFMPSASLQSRYQSWLLHVLIISAMLRLVQFWSSVYCIEFQLCTPAVQYKTNTPTRIPKASHCKQVNTPAHWWWPEVSIINNHTACISDRAELLKQHLNIVELVDHTSLNSRRKLLKLPATRVTDWPLTPHTVCHSEVFRCQTSIILASSKQLYTCF